MEEIIAKICHRALIKKIEKVMKNIKNKRTTTAPLFFLKKKCPKKKSVIFLKIKTEFNRPILNVFLLILLLIKKSTQTSIRILK